MAAVWSRWCPDHGGQLKAVVEEPCTLWSACCVPAPVCHVPGVHRPMRRNERILDSNSKPYEEIKNTGKGNYIKFLKELNTLGFDLDNPVKKNLVSVFCLLSIHQLLL